MTQHSESMLSTVRLVWIPGTSDPEPIRLTFRARRADVTHTPSGQADEWSMEIPSFVMPWDLQVFARAVAMQVHVWHHHERDVAVLDDGHPGYFTGIVDQVSRSQRDGVISMSGRGLQAVLVDATITSKVLRGASKVAELGGTLQDVCQSIIDSAFGGSSPWTVTDVTGRKIDLIDSLGRRVLKQLGKGETREFRQREADNLAIFRSEREDATSFILSEISRVEKTDEAANYEYDSHETVAGRPYLGSGTQDSFLTTKDLQLNDLELELETVNAAAPESTTPSFFAQIGTSGYRTVLYAHHIWGATQPKHCWDAIYRLCSLLGVVPTVTVLFGIPTVLLADALKLQTAANPFGQPFKRTVGGVELQTRQLTRGLSCRVNSEEIDISEDRSVRPSYVQVFAEDPNTGKIFESKHGLDGVGRAAFGNDIIPRGRAGARHMVDGVRNQIDLDRIARALFNASQETQAKISIEVPTSWSDGGDQSSPDMLSVRHGNAISVVTPYEMGDEAGRVTATAELVADGVAARMTSIGIDPETSARIARAVIQTRLESVFKVLSVQKSVNNGILSITLQLRRFLTAGRSEIKTTANATPQTEVEYA